MSEIISVQLHRNQNGFGIRLFSDTNSRGEVSTFVAHVLPQSSAYGQLVDGDRVIAVDSRSCVNMAHQDVTSFIARRQKPIITISVMRDMRGQPPMPKNSRYEGSYRALRSVSLTAVYNSKCLMF